MKLPRRTISKAQQEALDRLMANRSRKSGGRKRLFRGEEVEKVIHSQLGNLSQEHKTQITSTMTEAVRSMENRLNTQVTYALDKLEEKLLLAVANLPRPRDGEPGRDGKSVDRNEVAGIVSEMIGNLAKKEKSDDRTGLEPLSDKDRNVLLDLIREEAGNIVKNRPTVPSGGGTTYMFQLKDMPAKTKGTGPTYSGNEGKTLRVSSDGKSIEFGAIVGGALAVETPSGTVDDSNTTFTVVNEPVYVVINGAQYFDGAGYSYSGGTLTLDFPVGTGGFIRSVY